MADQLWPTYTTASAALTEALEVARRLGKVIARGDGGRECALAITKLEEAGMWLEATRQKIEDL